MMCFTAMDSQFVDDFANFICNMFYGSKDNNISKDNNSSKDNGNNKNSSSEIHDFNYYNQNYNLNHLNDYGKMILEILIITRDSLWKEITEASKIHSQLNKNNQDEIFKKYSNWPKDKQMQGYICKLISEKITGKYYSVHAENSSSKFMLHLMAPYSPLSNKYFQLAEYNDIINCLLLNQQLEEKDKKIIRILKLFCQAVNINYFNKLDNSHRINIVNRINNIIKYCSLENNMALEDYINDIKNIMKNNCFLKNTMESKDYVYNVKNIMKNIKDPLKHFNYINNVKNIMKNIKDPLECFNILLLYEDFLVKMTFSVEFSRMNFKILSLMIDKIKDNYSPEEKQIFNGIIDKLNDSMYIDRINYVKSYTWYLVGFLTHKEINNAQLLKIIIDNAEDRFGDNMTQIKKYTFFHEEIHQRLINLKEHKFTDREIAIINHNIRELSKSDKEDRKFI